MGKEDTKPNQQAPENKDSGVQAEPRTPVAPQTPQIEVPPSPTPAAPQPVQTTVQTDNQRTADQFEKLLDHNKQLFDMNEKLRSEMEERSKSSQQFEPIQQPPAQPQPVETVNPEDFIEVDPYSGQKFINEDKLKAKLQEANQKATQAQEAVDKYIRSAEEKEIDTQNREAFEAYPELNPNNPEKNDNFIRQTRSVIIDSLINPQDYGGKPFRFKEAADYVKKGLNKSSEENQENKSDVQPTEAQEAKTQVTSEASGQQLQTRSAPVDEDLAQLQKRTREGDVNALAERLSRTDHIAPDTSEDNQRTS